MISSGTLWTVRVVPEYAVGHFNRCLDQQNWLAHVVNLSVFHEKALFVKANVVAVTLERIVCPLATLPFAVNKL